MKITYSPVSIIAQICGSLAQAVALSSGFEPGLAVGIGSSVSAAIGGVNLNHEEASMRDFLSKAIESAWDSANKKYDLTEECMLELTQEVMGEQTTIEEFVRNAQRTSTEQAVATVIRTILLRHLKDLKIHSNYSWNYISAQKAATDISATLLNAIQNILEEQDSLRMMKAIIENRQAIDENRRAIAKNRQAISEIQLSNESSFSSLPSIKATVPTLCRTFIDGITRRDDLSNINDLIAQFDGPLWLYGESGIGKTELVKRFAKEHFEDVFIFTVFKESINQTLSEEIFDLPGYDSVRTELSDTVRYELNKNILRQYSSLLKQVGRQVYFVIDHYAQTNHDKAFKELVELEGYKSISGEENDFEELLLLAETGVQIIITSRNAPPASDSYIRYQVKPMCEQDLLDIMKCCFTRIQPWFKEQSIKDKLISLIRLAESKTVFVAMMALAMENEQKNALEALETMQETLDSKVSFPMQYAKKKLTMQQHVEHFLDFLHLSYQERQLLSILAFLPTEGMDYKLFRKLTMVNAVQLDHLRENALNRFIETQIVIVEYRQTKPQQEEDGIIQKADNEALLRIQQFIASYTPRIFAYPNPKTYLNLVNVSWISKLHNFIDHDMLVNLKADAQVTAYIPALADACSAAADRLEKLEELFASIKEPADEIRRLVLLKAAELCEKTGRVKNSMLLIERAIAVDGPSSMDMKHLWEINCSAGLLFFKGGNYLKAKELYVNALSILNNQNLIYCKEPDKPELYKGNTLIQFDNAEGYAFCFVGLIGAYSGLGDISKAVEYCETALEISKRSLGDNNMCTANVYNNVGSVFFKRGLNDQALEYHQKALEIYRRVVGDCHSYTAMVYNNICTDYLALGEYHKALVYGSRALEIDVRVRGAYHPETVLSYHNIATTYEEMGNYDDALKILKEVLAICESRFGTAHPLTALTYINIGTLYEDLGDYDKAVEFLEKGLAIRISELGKDHPDTQKTLQRVLDIKSRSNRNQ